MAELRARWLGRVRWRDASAMQTELAAARATGAVPDALLLLEHEPVYTLGRRATPEEVLLDERALAERGIEVERTDRGGKVTYHGPGQLVGYPILDLGPAGDLVAYVRVLERMLIDTCADLGVSATTVEGLTGAWVGDAKIGAIGVHVSRGITTHGFALNLDPDLGAFNGIVPCGIVDRTVTSVSVLTGAAPSLREAAGIAAGHLTRALGARLTWAGERDRSAPEGVPARA